MDYNKIITFPLIFVELIVSIIYLVYLYLFFKHKDNYPLKQLSISLTFAQGLSFFIYQLNLIILLALEILGYQISWEDCETNNIKGDLQHIYFFIFELIYLTSRGCGFTFTFIKSCRTLMIYGGGGLKSWRKQFCQQESVLVLIGLLHGLVFPVIALLSTINHYKFPTVCVLQVYENNAGYVMYNSWIEELLTIVQIFQVNKYYQSDKIVQLTLKLQFVYIFWFALNSLAFKIGVYFGFNLMIPVMLSCWIRCHYMFYYLIAYPTKNREQHPNVYLTNELIQDFNTFLQSQQNQFYTNKLVLKTFQQYLKQQNLVGPQNFVNHIYFSKKTEIDLFKVFMQIDQKLEADNLFDLNDQIQILLGCEQNPYPDIHSMHIDFRNHFEKMYVLFQTTKSFIIIKNICQQNELVLNNFMILNIQIDQFNILKSFANNVNESSFGEG